VEIQFAGDTHVGQKRETNQDDLLLMPEERVFVVADGMGGHLSGEVASQLAVESIKSFFRDTGEDADVTWPFRPDQHLDEHGNRLVTAIRLANRRIFETSRSDRKFMGMGTTVVAIYFADDAVYVAHVGDSRVYLFRDGELRQLTEDHSLLNDFKKNITMTQEDEDRFPYKNIIVRALGMKDEVEVDVQRLVLRENDTLLLCSDGLSGEVSDPEMEELLVQEPVLSVACSKLIEMANAAGGKDNITVVTARWQQEGASPEIMALDQEIAAELGRGQEDTGDPEDSADRLDDLDDPDFLED